MPAVTKFYRKKLNFIGSYYCHSIGNVQGRQLTFYYCIHEINRQIWSLDLLKGLKQENTVNNSRIGNKILDSSRKSNALSFQYWLHQCPFPISIMFQFDCSTVLCLKLVRMADKNGLEIIKTISVERHIIAPLFMTFTY